jgi:FAD/FMN-containing dehydrogenase
MDTEKLARKLRGPVLRAEDVDYEEARRIWNGRFNQRPALIVRCSGPEDVVAAIEFAQEHDVPLAVKGGGHSYAGHGSCDDGLLIDLSPMHRVDVDGDSRTARVEAGATWGEFDAEAQRFGLATPGGSVSTIGVAGLTLGGGSGYGTRKHGLTIDNLISADVITADGRSVRASEDENPDLFWALRGGGGNFGVVTSFEFELHELGPQVLAGQIVHPFRDARAVLEFYREFMAGAPDEVDCYAFALRVPPLDVFPEEHHGQLALDLVFFYCADAAEGQEVARPLRDFGEPILSAIQRIPYTTFKSSFDDGLPRGGRYDTRAHYLKDLSDVSIYTMLNGVEGLAGAYTIVYFEPLGGAIGRVAPEATAFPHREAAYSFHILAGWTDPGEDDEIMAWARDFHRAMSPDSTGGVYVNLIGREEEDRVRAAYGDNYDRLVEIKNEWDPRNLFRINHNIEPAG